MVFVGIIFILQKFSIAIKLQTSNGNLNTTDLLLENTFTPIADYVGPDSLNSKLTMEKQVTTLLLSILLQVREQKPG
jgi:hypothetical protein